METTSSQKRRWLSIFSVNTSWYPIANTATSQMAWDIQQTHIDLWRIYSHDQIAAAESEPKHTIPVYHHSNQTDEVLGVMKCEHQGGYDDSSGFTSCKFNSLYSYEPTENILLKHTIEKYPVKHSSHVDFNTGQTGVLQLFDNSSVSAESPRTIHTTNIIALIATPVRLPRIFRFYQKATKRWFPRTARTSMLE